MRAIAASLVLFCAGAGELSPAAPPQDDVAAPAPTPTPAPGPQVTPPVLARTVAPEYPAEAAARGISGSVVIAIVISSSGEVIRAVAEDPGPDPQLTRAALAAAVQLEFEPARIDGVPTAVEITYRFDFAAPPAPAAKRDPAEPPAPPPVEPAFAHVPLETTVRGERPPPIAEARASEGAVSLQRLRPDELRILPGSQGDTLRGVQNLPGVARAPFGIGLLVVRGSAPAGTRVYLDGVEVPLAFHFGGLTSVVSPEVISSLDFVPGNFSARFGRGTGGVVDLRTRDPGRDVHGAAQIDVLDGRTLLEMPVGRGGVFLGARRSWVGEALAVALPRINPGAAEALTAAPRYYDYHAKVVMPLGAGGASLSAFGADDQLTYVRGWDTADRPTLYLKTLFHRAAARVAGPLGSEVDADLVLSLGLDRIDVMQATAFGMLSESQVVALRESTVWRPSPRLAVEAGVDAQLRRFEYALHADPLSRPRELGGEIAGGEDAATGTWFTPAAYLELEWRPLPALRLVPALRLDHDSRLRRRATWLDPRASAFLQLDRSTRLAAAAGVYSEPPEPHQLTDVFGNDDLTAQRSVQYSLGARRELAAGASLEVTAFLKEIHAAIAETEALAADGSPLRLSNRGAGEAYGIELLLRREPVHQVFGWISYGWSSSSRRGDPTTPGYPRWERYAFDQGHLLTVLVSWRGPRELVLGTRLRAASGTPYTPAVASVVTTDDGRYRCLFSDRANSARQPAFFQADARVEKSFSFRRWSLAAFLDVANVTNRRNAEFSFWNFDCSERVAVDGIPVLPSLGVRAQW